MPYLMVWGENGKFNYEIRQAPPARIFVKTDKGWDCVERPECVELPQDREAGEEFISNLKRVLFTQEAR